MCLFRKKPKEPLEDSGNRREQGPSAGSQTRFDPLSEDYTQSEPSRGIYIEEEREVQGYIASGISMFNFQVGGVGRGDFPAKGNSRHAENEESVEFPSGERNATPEDPITLSRGFDPFKALLKDIYNASTSEELRALKNKAELLLIQMDSLSKMFIIAPEGDVPEWNRRDKLRCEIDRLLRSSSEEQGLQWLADKAQNTVRALEDIQEAIFRYQQDRKTAIYVKEMGEMGTADAVVLRGVRCAEKAEYRHSGRDGCLKGTRGAILDEIELWARGSRSRSVYWLNGLAGTGKTTIAQTVGERLWAGGLLGASFFCSRYSPDRSDLQLIFPTIAVQLARAFPQFRSGFVRLVNSDPGVVYESPRDQLEKLICGPLVGSRIQTIIIIDALDECKDKDSKSKILSALEDVLPKMPRVKFFVTGRPEQRIREGFLSKGLSHETDERRLHELAPDEVRRDIRAFFIRHFSNLKSARRILGEWPTQEELNRVCERAAGLFVYAMATIRFIQSGKNPKQKLRSLLESSEGRCEGGTEFLENLTLDKLYMVILEEAFGSDDKAEDHIVQSVLGAVVLAASPLSPNAIATLLKLDSEDVDPRLSSVQSVLLFEGNSDCPVRPFHNSFPDFIVDPKRCTNTRFCISPPHQHATLLDRCLEFMRTCRKLTDDVANFDLPLQYACRSWFRHLVNVPADMINEVTPGLRIFLEAKFFLWLEALSAIGPEGEVIDGLEATARRLNVLRTPNLICILTDAAKKAVEKGDLFKALLKTIFTVYADYEGPVTIRNEAEKLLSCMASLGMSTAHPGDSAEQGCWKELGLILKDVEERLEPLYGKPQAQKLDDYLQRGKDLFRSLRGIQEVIDDYLSVEPTTPEYSTQPRPIPASSRYPERMQESASDYPERMQESASYYPTAWPSMSYSITECSMPRRTVSYSIPEYPMPAQSASYSIPMEMKMGHEPLDPSEAAVLNGFPCAQRAGYRYCDNPGCLEGTREPILDEAKHWARGFGGPRVYWLNGLAGTGKTAIARTFAERMLASKRLGASFFCSRDFEDQSNSRLIFPTLAVQLARAYAEFRSIFVPLVRSDRQIASESLYNQIVKLLVQPLIRSGISTVIVIDALDECRDEAPVSAILSILSRFVADMPRVKFFVTGRPEPRIRDGFRLPLLAGFTKEFVLHEIEPSRVDRDIRLFFTHKFLGFRSRRPGLANWPTEEQLDILCDRTAGLFVYAMATVRFINERGGDPKRQLDRLLQSPESSVFEGKTEFKTNATLDSLYMSVLRGAFGDNDLEDDRKIQSVLGAVILPASPLSPHTIALLLDLDVEDVFAVLSSISSLIILHEDFDQHVQPFHKSFADFIVDPARCPDPRFRVHPADQHLEILVGCLKLMERKLEQNMCKLLVGGNNSEVDYLWERVSSHISPALQYACRSWHKHLVDTTPAETAEIAAALLQFLENKFLFWLEVLSLLGAPSEATDALEVVVNWSDNPSLSHLARDCLNFVITSLGTIDTSATEIYTSALFQTPQTSLVYGLYKQYAHQP